MNHLEIDRRERFIPSTPDELTGDQLLRCLRIVALPIPATAARIALLFVLLPSWRDRLRLRWLWSGPSERPHLTELRWLSRLFWPRLLDDDARLALLRLTDWLFTDEKPLTKQLLPVLTADGQRLHGPSEQARSLTYAQFYNAEAFYLLYQQTKNPAHLHSLVAILYLPFGVLWSNEDDFHLPARATAVARTDPAVHLAVFQFYHGCREYIVGKFKAVFPEPSEQQKLENAAKKNNPKQVRDFWRVKVRSQLAEGFVNLNAVDAAPVYQVLDQLNHLINEAKAEKRRQRLQELSSKTKS